MADERIVYVWLVYWKCNEVEEWFFQTNLVCKIWKVRGRNEEMNVKNRDIPFGFCFSTQCKLAHQSNIADPVLYDKKLSFNQSLCILQNDL